jgi:dTDP-4-dehydrorhamnose reductase
MSATPTTALNSKTNPRILIVGNAGQLGRELEEIFAGFGPIMGVNRESVDLADAKQTRELVRRAEPDIILNAAAYTAVDRAESERDLAYAINEQAPRVLAEEANRRNAVFVHYSTDYVFDGGKSQLRSTLQFEPWTETDSPNPLNVYGASKLAGEQAVEGVGGKFLIFRTSWVYGPHGKNFLLTMLRLARERDRLSIVDDQIGGPTTSIELARATHSIVTGIHAGRFGAPQDWIGIYHMTCAGSVSWFGFAQAIFARAAELLALKPPTLSPIATKDYPTPAARPHYSVLSNDKLQARFGVKLLPWESALEETLEALSNGG